MTRSERLAKEGKIDVYAGFCATAKVISRNEMHKRAGYLEYLGTDIEARYDGKCVQADVYEHTETGDIYAVIEN